jgi:hypothetical protein
MNDSEDQPSKAQRFSSAHKERAKGMIRERMGSRPAKKGPHSGDEAKKDYARGQRPGQEGSGRGGRKRFDSSAHKERAKGMIRERMGSRPRRVQAPGREEPSRGGERRFDQNQHRETIKERIQAMRARKQERRQERRQGRA